MNAFHKSRGAKAHSQPDIALMSDLSFAGQMSIWGVRLLAGGYREDRDVTKTLIDGFRKCNAIKAGSNLLFLMEIIFNGLSRNLSINCSCNLELTEDELKILDLFSLSQHFSNLSEETRLLDFLTEAAASNAIPIFNGYGDALRDAGLLLPVSKEVPTEIFSISKLMKPSSAFH
jgi:hypothetical protein